MTFNPNEFLDTAGTWHFIPDWDDLVDPNYDFITDTQKGKGWANSAYAHELMSPPPYDGILVSKVVEEKSALRKKRTRELGVKGALRVRPDFPVMGDCGAFGYIEEKLPPYTTSEVIDYYTAGGFDFGVSIDHLIPGPDHPDRQLRYDITIKNADEFIRMHRKLKPAWAPMGAVQGWDSETYGVCAAKLEKMGYRYLAIGGLVRKRNEEITEIVTEIRKVIHAETRIHLFGVARPPLFDLYREKSIFSVDSASALRRAWMGSTDNFHMPDGDYCAIRVPSPEGKRGPMKNMPEEKIKKALNLEQKVLQSLREFGDHKTDIETVMGLLENYENFYSEDGISRLKHYRRTLEARPWENCTCPLCKSAGIQVAIFRGNNRNRRRGFHNTYILQQKFLTLR
ncbi:hypothetical protein KKF34_07980 [Myxococcota bacterium]|nr:hypothetical protein [Myxococcota bacterium]MBU1379397.1 hypothetical protein [Myxococcota bacterium]MBU1496799.1 hypothetical protein [Myxococcota bacterium]